MLSSQYTTSEVLEIKGGYFHTHILGKKNLSDWFFPLFPPSPTLPEVQACIYMLGCYLRQ
jgi:hypothetical protein